MMPQFYLLSASSHDASKSEDRQPREEGKKQIVNDERILVRGYRVAIQNMLLEANSPLDQ